jgi:hypothetical protein
LGNSDNHKEQPLANRVYGSLIYWLAIAAAVICILAPLLTMAFPQRNVLDPQFLFSTIWQGAKPEVVWQTASGGFPGGHFWVNHLLYGDGIMQFGIVLGSSAAGIALLGAVIAFLRQKPKDYFWVSLSLIICIMIFLAAIGIYTQGGA